MSRVGKVVTALEEFGYQALKNLIVAEVEFHFSAALIGPTHTLDLVVVADAVTTPYVAILRQVAALTTALDVASSRRTLTIVLVGPKPDAETLNGLGSNCRVLPVGNVTSSEESEFRNWLSMFSPLRIPDPAGMTADPFEELANQQPLEVDRQAFNDLVSAARRSQQSVEQTLATLIKFEGNQ